MSSIWADKEYQDAMRLVTQKMTIHEADQVFKAISRRASGERTAAHAKGHAEGYRAGYDAGYSVAMMDSERAS